MNFIELMRLTKARIDIGCGGNKQKGFIGLDKRDLPGVDIVQDLEEFPWPLPDNSCELAIASHVVEHIKPWLMLDFMNEVWRVLEVGCDFCISVPYAGSRGFWQDPTHINGCNEVTWQYFAPEFPLYRIYKPKPWWIKTGFPVYQVQGNMEVILTKLSEETAETLSNLSSNDLGITVSDSSTAGERIGG